MTYGKIMNALPALRKLAEERLTIKTAYWLDKAMRALEAETAFFDARRKELLQKYGEDHGDGRWEIHKECVDAFNVEMEKLLNLETAVEIKPVKIPTSENITISCNDIHAIDGVVAFEFVEE